MQKQQLFLTLIRKTTFFKLKLISSAQNKKVWNEGKILYSELQLCDNNNEKLITKNYQF